LTHWNGFHAELLPIYPNLESVYPLTMYATDRQIIERLLIPAMMLVVLTGMRRALGENAGVLDPVNALLDEALREPVADMAPNRGTSRNSAKIYPRNGHYDRPLAILGLSCRS